MIYQKISLLLLLSIFIFAACELPLFKEIKERPKTPDLTADNVDIMSDVGADYIFLRFKPVKEADKYNIYLKSDDILNWKKHTDVDVIKTESGMMECKIKSLNSNSVYSFSVTSVTNNYNQESDKSGSITVKTKLKTPVITSVIKDNHYSMTYAWTSVPEADSYLIIYSDNSLSLNFIKITQDLNGNFHHDFPSNTSYIWNVKNNKFTINTFNESNKNYTVYVQAYSGSWGNLTNISDFNKKQERTMLRQPVMLAVDEQLSTSSTLFLSWEPVIDAESYEIRYCEYFESNTLNIDKWKEKTITKRNNQEFDSKIFIDELNPYTLYVYKVRAHSNNNISLYSEQSLAYRTRLGPPVIIRPDITSNSIKINWQEMDNVFRYKLYRSGKNVNTPLTPVNIVRNILYYQLDNLIENNDYNFSLSAIDVSGYESDVKELTYYTLLSKPENFIVETISDKEIALSWDAKNGATGYAVEIYDINESKPFKENVFENFIISDLNYTVNELTPNNRYNFVVRAVNKNAINTNEDEPRKGDPSVQSSAITLLSAPQILSHFWFSRSVEFSWGDVTGANSYKIYYNTSNSFDESDQYNPGHILTINNCIVQGLDRNTNYYLWVQAFNNDGNYSLKSQVLGGKTIISNADIIFDFTNPADPTLQGMPEKIIQIKKESYTIKVIKNGAGWANSYKWYLNGIVKNVTGDSFIIDWNLPVGSYELTVVATRYNVPYSASAKFKVLNN